MKPPLGHSAGGAQVCTTNEGKTPSLKLLVDKNHKNETAVRPQQLNIHRYSQTIFTDDELRKYKSENEDEDDKST